MPEFKLCQHVTFSGERDKVFSKTTFLLLEVSQFCTEFIPNYNRRQTSVEITRRNIFTSAKKEKSAIINFAT
jgi:hypothetical protein